MSFTHLHVHTEYSLLDGSGRIKEMIARAKELNMDSLAITDHGVMYGVIDFYKAAREMGINPILGCEVYVSPGSRFDRETGAGEERYYHLILLAENHQGYQNLMKIVSRGFTEGFYYKPRVDAQVLEEFHEGIIALSACLAGEVATYLRKGLYEEAKEAALSMEKIFGKENYFLELQDHGLPEQRDVNQGLMRMSQETGIPLVATNDVHYVLETDAEAHDVLLCIQTQKKVSDEDRMRYTGGQFYLKSQEEMETLFPYAREALENTGKIADRCHVEIVFGEYKLPQFPVPPEYTAKEYLDLLCREGLEKRYPNPSQELKDRMRYELDTIEGMGFVDYFLIVWDFIKYAKDHDIPVGPGRGSAAGSIVAYSLGITDIDPIRYQLLFERFLNPERLTMPDIDVDFCYTRRGEVIDYVVEKYGKDRVVQIVTFGTMAAKMVIRDVGRAMDLPYNAVDAIAKMIPGDLGMTIDKALTVSKELRDLCETDEKAANLIRIAKRLEGLPRHTSMHAAGVVISKLAVEEYVPLSKSSDDTITTQYTMTTLEELGLLKMDFLGLRTLTVIQNAAKLAGIAIEDINYEDSAVFDMIGTGKTEGVFQLESAGMKSFMKELKPQNIEDVIAGISLYRPGPMDFIPQYIQGKNHPDKITYETAALEPILEPTYGCIVYQEQVMQIVRELAGYSFGRSDLVRRAMSKKKAAVMEKERQNFVYGNQEEHVPGCVANGIPEEVANHIYDEMTDFAKYAFNKSHAAAYAIVAYRTAYLKYYFPVEFMAALMSSVMDNTAKVTEYILSCRQMDISILPPDVNHGTGGFTVDHGSIRYALAAIKGLGVSVIDTIVREREENGPYVSLKDFIDRLSSKEVNKRTLENLILSGSMDTLPGNRREKILAYPGMMDTSLQEKKNTLTGQMSLFDLVGKEEKQEYEEKAMPETEEYSKKEKLALEKEVLGIYLSGHPMEEVEDLWRRNITNTVSDFFWQEETGGTKVRAGGSITIGGVITDCKKKTTRNNAMMAFLTLEDLTGSMEILVFPRQFEKYAHDLEVDQMVLIGGSVSEEEEKDAKLILERVTPLAQLPRELWIQLEDKATYEREKEKIERLLAESDGKDRVCLFCRKEKAVKRLSVAQSVHATEELRQKLAKEFGPENVKIS